jgi:hypothetical protein
MGQKWLILKTAQMEGEMLLKLLKTLQDQVAQEIAMVIKVRISLF